MPITKDLSNALKPTLIVSFVNFLESTECLFRTTTPSCHSLTCEKDVHLSHQSTLSLVTVRQRALYLLLISFVTLVETLLLIS